MTSATKPVPGFTYRQVWTLADGRAALVYVTLGRPPEIVFRARLPWEPVTQLDFFKDMVGEPNR